jgi:hypothetical protein
MNKKPIEDNGLTDTGRFRKLYTKSMRGNNTVRHIGPSDTGKYLTAILGSLVIGIGGVALLIWLRPDYDPLLVAGVIFAFLTPTTTSLLSFFKASEAKEQAQETAEQATETHLSVNSRLDAFIRQAAALARAEGLSEGEEIGRNAANTRTDELKKGQGNIS